MATHMRRESIMPNDRGIRQDIAFNPTPEDIAAGKDTIFRSFFPLSRISPQITRWSVPPIHASSSSISPVPFKE